MVRKEFSKTIHDITRLIMEKLKKLGFKKIKNTGPGFHMWELDSRDIKTASLFDKIVYTDLTNMKVKNDKKNKA